jgi:hypothetical protein
MRDLRRTFDTMRVACGLYLLTGFIGASLAAAGLLLFLEASPAAPTLILLGGALAAAAWHRGRTVLEHAGRASAGAGEVPDAPMPLPSPRNHGRGAIVIATRLSTRSPRRHDEHHRRSTSG